MSELSTSEILKQHVIAYVIELAIQKRAAWLQHPEQASEVLKHRIAGYKILLKEGLSPEETVQKFNDLVKAEEIKKPINRWILADKLSRIG